ncbi:hypothetical protein SDC9_110791 [bioreactor metagenome]|uniref:Uncharacterized protein n=1 Tax=bioreactor metagenome TaxID=1076179 RepID=A0A645BEZ8_9ZZZZ
MLLVAGILGARALFKRMKLSRQSNILLTALVCVALAVGFTVLRFRLIASEAEQGRLGGRSPAAVYTVEASDGGTWTWKAYNDPLPLRLEDLQAVPEARYSYEWTVQESVLMGYYTARQFSHPEDWNAPDLRYEVVDVKLDWLYEPSLNQYFRRYSVSGDYPTEFQRQLRRTDDPNWQADAVYQLFRQDIALSEYLICWGSRLVYIQFDEIPAADQIAVAAEKLRAA